MAGNHKFLLEVVWIEIEIWLRLLDPRESVILCFPKHTGIPGY